MSKRKESGELTYTVVKRNNNTYLRARLYDAGGKRMRFITDRS